MAVLALAIADRGYVIDSGKIVREDSAVNLAGDPEVEAAYLGHAAAAQ
jgi:ABC-type branched-subunit amino acid transport system ATPase component